MFGICEKMDAALVKRCINFGVIRAGFPALFHLPFYFIFLI